MGQELTQAYQTLWCSVKLLRHVFDSVIYFNYIQQGYTNPGRQVVVTTVFCTVTPNICGSWVWNLPHVTLLAPRIFRWILYFEKVVQPWNMVYSTTLSASQATPVTSNSKLFNGSLHSLTHSLIYLFTYLLTYLITYLLTPWNRVLLEKPAGFQLVKKFPAFYGTRMFITPFTSTGHLSLSWARSIQPMPPHPTSWRSILILSSHLSLGLPSGLFPSGWTVTRSF